MMIPDTELQIAERHVREGEGRVVRQKALIQELDRDGHSATAGTARRVLVTLNEGLALARAHAARLKGQITAVV